MTKLSDDFHSDLVLIQNGEAVPNRYDTLPLPQHEEAAIDTSPKPDPYRRVILIGGPEV